MINHRFNHRCLSCWNGWYTRKRDAKALCPKCFSENTQLYVLFSYAKKGKRILWYSLLGWSVVATVLAAAAGYLAWR